MPQKCLHTIGSASYHRIVNPKGNGSVAPPSSSHHEQRRDIKRIVSLYIVWLIAAVMLVSAATQKHPYSFYMLLRWICCPVFAYSAVAAYQKNRAPWVWIFGTLALLYNPIFRVHLDRSTWIGVNWLTAGAIVIAAAVFWRQSSSSPPASS